MATRFGAVSPTQAYQAKVRWLVAGMIVVISLLLGAIFVILSSGDQGSAPQTVTDAQQSAAPVAAAQAEVLVASVRIEEGARLEPHMFNTVPMDEDRLPMGVVQASQAPNVIGKFANRLINANMPLVMDDVSEMPPVKSFNIPPGYRAVTITVDARSGVEGFAKPNSRVDVLWTYAAEGKKKVATISRFVKVLSVAGSQEAGPDRAALTGTTTVSLLVTEKDAKKIELARTLGTLSLSLVGDQETATPSGEPDTITINDLIGKPAQKSEPAEVANDGVMYTSDPHTGKQLRYVLRNGRWALDRSFGGGD